MFNQKQDAVTVSVNPVDTAAIQKLEQILESSDTHPRLIGSNGEIVLPEPIYQALCDIVRAIGEGKSISLSPIERELSTQEAAIMLNVSRPYLIDKLLKTGKIPHFNVGTHRRIRLQDLTAYKEKRDQERRHTMEDLTQFLQDEGFYDE